MLQNYEYRQGCKQKAIQGTQGTQEISHSLKGQKRGVK